VGRLLSAAAAVLGFLLSGAAAAQSLVTALEYGLGPALPGIVLRQPVGPVTGGDMVDVAVGDCDGDGRPDLFTGSSTGDLLYFYRAPDEVLEPGQSMLPEATDLFAPPGPARQVTPDACDWDGDGDMDLLVALGGRLYLFALEVRDNERRFAPPVLLSAQGTPQSVGPDWALCALQADGDGLADLLTAGPDGQVLLLRRTAGDGAACLAAPVACLEIPAGRQRLRLGAGDWNGDTVPDLVLAAADGTVEVRTGVPGADRVSWPVAEPVGGPGMPLPLGDTPRAADLSPRLADWDGNGLADLIVGDRRGLVHVLLRGSTAELSAAVPLLQRDAPIDVGRSAAGDLGDWDGDGDQDLIAGGEDGAVWFFANDDRGREGYFRAGVPLRLGEGLLANQAGWVRPRLCDWDGDGTLDLLLAGGGGAVVAYAGSRSANVGAGQPVMVGGRPVQRDGVSAVCPRDYNRDGKLDLFAGWMAAPGAAGEQPLVYLENVAVQPRQAPVFTKAAQLDINTMPTGGELPLRPFAIEPAPWLNDGRWEFLIVGRAGVDLFLNRATERLYPLLEAAPGETAHILPPVASCVTGQLDGRLGLLAGSEGLGLLCWYDRGLWRELDALSTEGAAR